MVEAEGRQVLNQILIRLLIVLGRVAFAVTRALANLLSRR
jgi:hypothetical protein